MESIYFEDVDIHFQIPGLIRKIGLIELIKYSASTWNFYLLHLEKEFAQRKGFQDVSLHAPFYGAFLAATITQWTGDPSGLKKMEYRVEAMGFSGETFKSGGQVVRKYLDLGENLIDCDLFIKNQEDRNVASGSATLFLPSKRGSLT